VLDFDVMLSGDLTLPASCWLLSRWRI